MAAISAPAGRGHMPITGLADIEALERVPLDERIDTWDTFELIERGSAIDPAKVAIHYLPDADLDGELYSLTYQALMGRIRQAANLFRDLGVGPSDVRPIAAGADGEPGGGRGGRAAVAA